MATKIKIKGNWGGDMGSWRPGAVLTVGVDCTEQQAAEAVWTGQAEMAGGRKPKRPDTLPKPEEDDDGEGT